MSASPVTLMVARRVANSRYQDFNRWLNEGRELAADFPGYLGSGVLAPPKEDDEYQIIFRFDSQETLSAWEHSASRHAWLERGKGRMLQDYPPECLQLAYPAAAAYTLGDYPCLPHLSH